MNTIHDHLTPGRRRWLERLNEEGMIERRPRGNVGYHCMHLGWTEWVFEDKKGRRMVKKEAIERYGYGNMSAVKIVGEAITEAGLAKLLEATHG